jgi:hypothetical protein
MKICLNSCISAAGVDCGISDCKASFKDYSFSVGFGSKKSSFGGKKCYFAFEV